jgi:translocator protein
MSMQIRRLFELIVFVTIMFLAAFPAFFFPPGQWYQALQKPDWNPPAFLFGPVWSVLYVVIAVSIWRVWPSKNEAWARKSILVWGVQWLLNAAWSVIFFGLKQPGLALIEILLLLCVIGLYIVNSYRHNKLAGGLFVPYFLWVSFATCLNASIWYLNR